MLSILIVVGFSSVAPATNTGMAREQARASDEFMSTVHTLARLTPTTDSSIDPVVLAQQVLGVLEPPSWETQETA
jgi:hypothetical protein